MTPNIGSFPLDFTGSFRRQLGHGTIDGFLPLTAYCHRRALQQQHLGDGPSYSASAARDQTNLLTEWFHEVQHRPHEKMIRG
jgi:hypothetical protein